MTLRFNDRVAVVTGAGAGLGREYALLLASRGAKVVVNDLGGNKDGTGNSSKAADIVVDEIRKSGGVAVADYNSVVEGEKIIKTALDNFGKVDILINNAGILRDRSFARISEQDWDLIHQVHVKGSFMTTQAAFPHFKKQGYGRIIMTSSAAGVCGNFGQANYAAAKTALLGLSNTIAIEGTKNNIHCNVIIPAAGSRLTKDVFPPDMYEQLKPELIAPVVAYLTHETCQENGSVIYTSGGWAGKCTMVKSKGALLRQTLTDSVTIENVRDKWSEITEMKNATSMRSIHQDTGELLTSLEQLRNRQAIPEFGTHQDIYTFNQKDLILYALGVGASVDNPNELRFLYENHELFTPLPTFFILPSLAVVMSSNVNSGAIPGKSIDFTQILHGEQYLEITPEIPYEGVLLTKAKVVEVLDKGSGAVIATNIECYNEEGRLAVRNQIVTFAVGAGNFGGPRTGTKIIPCVDRPNRNPDKSFTYTTNADQAALYRLSGDRNPLHIDPNFSAIAGYEIPILHGLCTLGISVRLIVGGYADYDIKLFKALKVRFTKPVTPGQKLRIDTWREGNRIHFETVEVATNTTVIGGAYVDLTAVKMTPLPNKLAAAQLQSDAIFESLVERIKQEPQKAKGVNAVFLCKITKDGKPAKEWTLDLKNATIYEGSPKDCKANTTVTISDADFVDLALGKLNPQQAFMKQKLKVSGNIMLAQKLGPLLKTEAKL